MTTMLNNLRQTLQSPARRKKILLFASGGLILAALAAGQWLPNPTWHNLLMAAAAVIAGADIALRAWHSLRNRHISIELLVTIAATGALIIGEYWEAAAVTFLFILGAYLEARTLGRTRQVLQSLLDLAPTTALVVRDGRQVEIAPHEVLPGEIVLIKPGAKVAVDGDIQDGFSSIDESAITGESMPVDKQSGDQVFAGTINQAGLLHVRATGVGVDTTLAKIIRRVEQAQDEKAPTQRFIERFAQYYTPFIIMLSAVAYLITQDAELALTLLVIGCPGALVISTPVSVVAGIGRAAKAGILIKGGEYLENAGKISALALDKTGTLTLGRPVLTDIIVLQTEAVPAGFDGTPRAPISANELLRLAAIAESGSEHPLSQSILKHAYQTLGDIPHADRFETFTGRGVRAFYQGEEIVIGAPPLLDALMIDIPTAAHQALNELKSNGKTAVLAAINGQVSGVLGIADTIRPESAQMVAELRRVGVQEIVMLTGDDPLTAKAIAAQAGIDQVHASLLPEDKLTAIRNLQAKGHVVAMLGDGINDAPALAAADIGIAMGVAGTGVAIETADIALMADDLMKLPEAVRLSRATLNNIRQNVVIALLTVAGLLLGVLLGEVHMASGMLIHEASVLIVILNGMRLLR